ncbi:rCG47317 [Rattus norvegicus]|uniref:RCG47317 n=1 Tax=Rattus norvegicus TaxID=10116 RepID=A6I189_RAT|nr:rCG47317 [Rattus norvegicus]
MYRELASRTMGFVNENGRIWAI